MGVPNRLLTAPSEVKLSREERQCDVSPHELGDECGLGSWHAHTDDCFRTQAAGVEGFFSAKDVPGDNRIGAVVHDEDLFATDIVTCVGQVRIVLLHVSRSNSVHRGNY